jgi:ribonuclease HII
MRYVIGIDEVGRGALAGPVVVAAAMVKEGAWKTANRPLIALKDSKQLTPRQREVWFRYFKENPGISFAVARVYPRQIEKRNISGAANLAALRAYKKLFVRYHLAGARHHVLLDGSLFLGSKAKQPSHAKTIIKGDEKVQAIAIASIIAKVSRDRFMAQLAKKYADYGFDIHKGYGTKLHREALRTHGPSIVHRLTFLKNSATIKE